MTAPHLLRGKLGEQIARRWLEARGLRHILSNYRCRYGELDLVMMDKGCLVIIEVRYRRHSEYGGALPTITQSKQQKIARATNSLIQSQRKLEHIPLRFDVLGLSGPPTAPVVDWRRHAFSFDTD